MITFIKDNNIDISIHSPRVGRDLKNCKYSIIFNYFNPLSPCGERPSSLYFSSVMSLFQSTLPVWGETPAEGRHHEKQTDFNPLSPCGERHHFFYYCILFRYFNPLSPCGERPGLRFASSAKAFQSTLPVWGETFHQLHLKELKVFQSTLPVWGETYMLSYIIFLL